MAKRGSEKIVVLTCKSCKHLYSKKSAFGFLKYLSTQTAHEVLSLLKNEVTVEFRSIRSSGHCQKCYQLLGGKRWNKDEKTELHPRQKSMENPDLAYQGFER